MKRCNVCPLHNLRHEDRRALRNPQLLKRYRENCEWLRDEGECKSEASE